MNSLPRTVLLRDTRTRILYTKVVPSPTAPMIGTAQCRSTPTLQRHEDWEGRVATALITKSQRRRFPQQTYQLLPWATHQNTARMHASSSRAKPSEATPQQR